MIRVGFLSSRRVARAWMISLAAGGLLWTVPGTASAQICAAALDIDVHYCLNGPPQCDPLAFTDGMPVELTVEVTNDSQFQPSSPADPPGGELTVGKTIKVYYSCSASTCLAGQQLANWFTFNGIQSILPGVSFADDGNGYSGTITIVAPGVLYASGDGNPKDLVVLNLTANSPPGGGFVYARAGQPTSPGNDSSDTALLLTDPGCLPGLTGGGQGSTIGQFAGGDDFGTCNHPNKQTIGKDRSGALDVSKNRVSFEANPSYDPSLCGFHFGYANDNGLVHQWVDVNAGDLSPVGPVPPGGTAGCYVYQNKSAKSLGGTKRVRVCQMRPSATVAPDTWCFNFEGWDDFDANVTLPKMWMTLDLTGASAGCGQAFKGPLPPTYPDPIWDLSPKKCVLPRTAWIQ